MGLFKKLFDNAPKGLYKSYNLGNFIVDLYYDEDDTEKCYAEIHSATPCLDVKLMSNHDGYGLLMTAASDDDKDSITAYCSFLAICAALLAMDTEFLSVVSKAFEDWQNRMLDEAKAEAEKLMPSEEEANQALMNEAVRIASMSDDERREYARNVMENLKNSVGADEEEK